MTDSLFDFDQQTGGISPRAFARASDPKTSWDAARSVENLRPRQESVLDVLRRYGPLTDERIAVICGREYPELKQSPSGYRTRRAELVSLGLVKDSGTRGKTASGRNTIIWAESGENHKGLNSTL